MPKYIVAVGMSGTRNGEDWPKPGEPIELPKDEGDAYEAVGIVRAHHAEERATAPKAETRKK